MPILKKEEHEAFAVIVAAGEDPVLGYAKAKRKIDMAESSAKKGAKRWMKRDDIKERISELKVQVEKDIKEKGGAPQTKNNELLTRHRALQILSNIAEADDQAGNVKIAAISKAADLCQWNAPVETDQTITFITEMPGPLPLPEQFKKKPEKD